MSAAIFFAVLLYTGSLVHAEGTAPDAVTQCRSLGRGVNVLGYDPIWRANGQGRFQQKYFRMLKEAGFQSLRINLYPFRYMDATNGFAIRPTWLGVLDWAVTNAQSQGLTVILDLHEFTAIGGDPAANKDKFLAFWRQVSARFRSAPDNVLFEVLNEPSRKLTSALWNDYFREALSVIREKNPTRSVIVGPVNYNSIHHLAELELPEADRHLIVTVHYYEPMEFTHQGASWTGQQDKLGVDWTAAPEELGKINKDFDEAAAWASAHNRPIFLGEFGAYDKAPIESRVRYIGTVARAAEARGWSWAYWQFDSDFILYDVKRDAWVEPILRALVPASASKP